MSVRARWILIAVLAVLAFAATGVVGIVAWHGRDASMLYPDDFMLVTASVIGGNSGGVVVNTRGEAVSLVSYGYAIYTQTVPIDRALAVADVLEQRSQ